jgi:hypothetical protein
MQHNIHAPLMCSKTRDSLDASPRVDKVVYQIQITFVEMFRFT